MSNPGKFELKKFIQGLAPISDDEFEVFWSFSKFKVYQPREFFTKVGEEDLDIGFTLKGLFKSYYITAEGDKLIRQFARTGDPLGAYSGLLASQPSNVCIEAMEESLVVQMKYENFVSLYERGAGWNMVGRKIAERYYMIRERREYHFLSLSAEERYEQFLYDFPGLEERITKVNIASYLGISPVSLSRILGRRKQKK